MLKNIEISNILEHFYKAIVLYIYPLTLIRQQSEFPQFVKKYSKCWLENHKLTKPIVEP